MRREYFDGPGSIPIASEDEMEWSRRYHEAQEAKTPDADERDTLMDSMLYSRFLPVRAAGVVAVALYANIVGAAEAIKENIAKQR